LISNTRGNLRIEILIIGIVALIYARPLLVMHPSLGLPGREYQAHVGTMVLIKQWLASGGEFPLWNPVVGTGRSLIADPFLSVFNPFVSVPMILFGVVNGSKIALLMNFFIAGLGMWTICKILNFRGMTRLWCSLLYMMSGAIPAHLTNGQIQLAYALAWLPWSIAGLLWVLKKPSATSVTLASLAQALFFFTGNLYYQVYALFSLAIIGFIFIVDWSQMRLVKEKVPWLLLMVVMSLGLISVQFLPELVSQSSIHNSVGYLPDETEFHGSQRPENAILNYFVSDKDFFRTNTLDKAPYLQESYRYIGIAPFLMLMLLVPTLQRGHRKEIIAFALSFLFLLAWAGMRYTFVKDLYQLLPFLNQFRWPGRALSVGGLFIILVSAYCLDFLLSSIETSPLQGHSLKAVDARFPHLPRLVFSSLVLVGLLIALRRVYLENQEIIYLDRITKPEVESTLRLLQTRGEGLSTIHASISIAELGALGMYEYGLRSPDIIDGWTPEGSPLNIGNAGAVDFQPEYLLNWGGDDMDHEGLNFVRQLGMLQVWLNPDAFPYAFYVPSEDLYFDDYPLYPDDVRRVNEVTREDFNRIQVDLEPRSESTLIVIESWFSGWRVFVDQQPAEIFTVSNYLAVQIPPGRHQVTFEYHPLAFTIGAWISGFSTLLVLGIFVRERWWRRND
jgi:hypothetical protein